MASIRKDILLDAPADQVWEAVADFGALHTKLVPGFVTDTQRDGDVRIVTFANGSIVREILVDCDPARRRLAYAIVSERLTQHSASVEIIEDGPTRCRAIWITDVLPHEIGPYMEAQMDLGARAMQARFRGRTA
jgi:Polyketide cyclase / dehydrase and lipid transport